MECPIGLSMCQFSYCRFWSDGNCRYEAAADCVAKLASFYSELNKAQLRLVLRFAEWLAKEQDAKVGFGENAGLP